MKRKEKTVIFGMPRTDLDREIREGETKLVKIRMEKRTKPEKNVRQARTIRRRLALIKTIRSQKSL